MKKISFLSAFFILMYYNAAAQSNSIGSGIALEFNGSPGNYVDIGDVYNNVSFPITVEAWIYLQGYPPIYAGIFASDNDINKYYGFWVFYTSNGTLKVEFGNGQGAGYQYRRGYETTESLALNKWVHVAVVCNSMTDIHIYFNGVEKSVIPTDGTSTSTTVIHSSANGSIGRLVTPFAEHNFNGVLDELRLWNSSRSQNDIRNYMCRKISSNSLGLIGLWRNDESYSNNTVHDYAAPSENGNINGIVNKISSGAPIGDLSDYKYTSSWTGISLTSSSSLGDKLTASKITGNPYGIHVYVINSKPFSTTGLNNTPNSYFGVFCAENNSNAGFKVVYKYSGMNGVITSDNENSASLMKRNDGSAATWTNLNGLLDTSLNRISKANQATYKEYTLNISGEAKSFVQDGNQNTSPVSKLNAFPNPSCGLVTVVYHSINKSDVLDLEVINTFGKLIIKRRFSGLDEIQAIDLTHEPSGVYFIKVGNANQSSEELITIAH